MFLDKLRKCPLDPKYELTGNFIVPQTDYNTISTYKNYLGAVQFYGQFYDEPLKFNLLANDDRLISLLTKYIRSNQSTQAYQDLRKSCSIFDPEPLSRFNIHIKRDVVLPKKHHVNPINIWIVDADSGFYSYILKLGGERVFDKFRFYTNPTTKLMNFINLLGTDKIKYNVTKTNINTITPSSQPNKSDHGFSRRKMRDDANKSFRFIGDRILAALKNIKRITDKLPNENEGPHLVQLKNKLKEFNKNLNYWVCVSAQKDTSTIPYSLFQNGNHAIVDNHRCRIVDAQKHIVAVEVLDNEHIGMIYHYPHAAFTDVYPQNQKLSIVA